MSQILAAIKSNLILKSIIQLINPRIPRPMKLRYTILLITAQAHSSRGGRVALHQLECRIKWPKNPIVEYSMEKSAQLGITFAICTITFAITILRRS